MTQKAIPVLIEFDWERQEAIAQYDAANHTLTMKIRPGGPVDGLLAGTVPDSEIRALSFGWTQKAAMAAADDKASQTALDVLMRLSEESDDGRLRDAIALVRSALHDDIEGRS